MEFAAGNDRNGRSFPRQKPPVRHTPNSDLICQSLKEECMIDRVESGAEIKQNKERQLSRIQTAQSIIEDTKQGGLETGVQAPGTFEADRKQALETFQLQLRPYPHLFQLEKYKDLTSARLNSIRDKDRDPEFVEMELKCYIKQNEFQNAVSFLELLAVTDHRERTSILRLQTYLLAGRHMLKTAKRKDGFDLDRDMARKYFRWAFELTYPTTSPNTDGEELNEEEEAECDSDWHVMILHEPDDPDMEAKAGRLKAVLREVCGLRITCMSDDVHPGALELFGVEDNMEKSRLLLVVMGDKEPSFSFLQGYLAPAEELEYSYGRPKHNVKWTTDFAKDLGQGGLQPDQLFEEVWRGSQGYCDSDYSREDSITELESHAIILYDPYDLETETKASKIKSIFKNVYGLSVTCMSEGVHPGADERSEVLNHVERSRLLVVLIGADHSGSFFRQAYLEPAIESLGHSSLRRLLVLLTESDTPPTGLNLSGVRCPPALFELSGDGNLTAEHVHAICDLFCKMVDVSIEHIPDLKH
nr:hypothetical protein BaRGS_002529 [Batillaria attramentaria]